MKRLTELNGKIVCVTKNILDKFGEELIGKNEVIKIGSVSVDVLHNEKYDNFSHVISGVFLRFGFEDYGEFSIYQTYNGKDEDKFVDYIYTLFYVLN